ncbi:MAG: BON domain-containing protein [Gammaproteobacteria bacterium]
MAFISGPCAARMPRDPKRCLFKMRSVKMKSFMSSMAVLALIASGAVWAGETGQTSSKPFKSSETTDPTLEEQGSAAQDNVRGTQGRQGTTERQSGQGDEKSGAVSYIDDAMITAKVKAALAKDPGASALAIEVETTKGMVQLSGSVDSADEKMKAESIARGVDGVKGVENGLKLGG